MNKEIINHFVNDVVRRAVICLANVYIYDFNIISSQILWDYLLFGYFNQGFAIVVMDDLTLWIK